MYSHLSGTLTSVSFFLDVGWLRPPPLPDLNMAAK
jgi:hypothetical protein